MATLVQAVRMALHYGEAHLGVTDVFGEDVGPPLGGVFTATQGLKTAWNSPLDERGIIGTAMGIAYAGGRPVCEIQFCDYAFNALDLLKVAGNQRWASAGAFAMPIVVMTPTGAGIRGSMYHSHSFESWASRLPGWKVVLPSNPLDAYGLMLAAIKDPNPVLVLLPKALLRAKGGPDERIPGEPADPDELSRLIDAPVGDRSDWQPQWPDLEEHIVPIGRARLAREGINATVVSYGRLLPLCVQAADELERDFGYTFDVIDLRSIFPYDWAMISASLQKTGRLLIANEDTEVTNFGEHLLRRAIDDHFYDLLARPVLIMGEHLPGIGMNQVYETNSVPQYEQVRDGLRNLAAKRCEPRVSVMDFPLPPVGEGLFEVELVRWLVKPGEAVHRGQGLAELMSDKATMELPAPFAGTVSATLAAEGSKVKVGQVILKYESDGERRGAAPPSETTTSQPAPAKVEAAARNGGVEPRRSPGVAVLDRSLAPVAAPSVRHLARKLGVDLGKVRGTGPAGRVLLDDLTAFITPKAAPAEKHVKGPDRDPTHGLDLGKPGTRTKLAGLRRKIAEKMVLSVRTIPHYSYIDECEITDLVKLRGQIKDTLAAAGVKMTYLPFFVKAVARALKDVPAVNATFDEATEEVTLHDHYHIGIAVSAPNGLIVPVVKDADKKDVSAIATEIDRLSKEVRAGRPRIDDLRGATFTITNIGNIGGLISTPIINHPEVGIMGIGKVIRRPVYDAHGDLRPADLVYLSFSFDHRVLDGAVGAAFGNAVVRHLQNPATLLLPERFGV